MSASRFFCSTLSREHGEQIYGTAPRIRSWLLIEYPGAWRRDAIEESDLPDPVKQQLEGIAQGTPDSRQLVIRRNHRRLTGGIHCFLVNSEEQDPASVAVLLSGYEEIRGADWGALRNSPKAFSTQQPLFLVCTHGRHDKCCAKFGLPVYHALRELAGHQVWECSHVGGDRFAANVICFPHGLYYGHVTVEDAPAIVESYRAGEIHLKNYRGRVCYSRMAQIGEFYIRAESGIVKIDGLRFLSTSKLDETTRRVRFAAVDGNMHEADIRIRETAFREYPTCQATEKKDITQYDLNGYRVTRA